MEGKVTKIWATVLLNRAYLAGMLVLNHSLRKAGTRYPLKVMLTSEAQTDIDFVAALRAADIGIITVDKVEAKRDGKVIKGMWQNLAAWKLTEYERVVLLHSDQLIVKNIDNLMDMPLPPGFIAASHNCTCNPRGFKRISKDWTPQTCIYTITATANLPHPISALSPATHHLLNSGALVLRPSLAEYAALLSALTNPAERSTNITTTTTIIIINNNNNNPTTNPTATAAPAKDQDELLAVVYRDRWTPLPYTYNALETMRSCHAGLWRDGDVRVVHYIYEKPWRLRREKKHAEDEEETEQRGNKAGPGSGPGVETHGWWWKDWREVEAEWLAGDGGGDADADKKGERRVLWEAVVKGAVVCQGRGVIGGE